MKVEIIDSNDSKRMTIEELGKKHKWIGGVTENGKRMIVCHEGRTYGICDDGVVTGKSFGTRQEMLEYSRRVWNYEYHVFDTAKELFAWMAE